jgi:queuine tRNA-ribosyltransferase
MILSWVNTVFYQNLMAAMREAISNGNFENWAAATKSRIMRPPAAQ